MNLPVGARVKVPYRTSISDTQPWLNYDHRGTLLDLLDPRAWANTLQFPGDSPSRAEVAAYVLTLPGGLLRSRRPVLWDFGRVYWEPCEALTLAVDATA